MSGMAGKNLQKSVLGAWVCMLLCAWNCVAEDNLYVSAVYYGGDWGPALVKKATEKKPAVYDDTHKVVYFIKHAVTYKGRKGLKKAWQGEYEFVEDRLALCVMEADGSGRQEIADLWVSRDKGPPRGPTPGTYEGVCLDVCPKGRKAAWSVELAGGPEVRGLWTVNLDGSGFRRIREPKTAKIMRANWGPDGEWLVFEEYEKTNRRRRKNSAEDRQIFKCDKDGSNCVALTKEYTNTQPTVSPDGKTIAYTCWPVGEVGSNKPKERLADGSELAKKYRGNLSAGQRFIQLMNVDGSDQRPLYKPDGEAVWGQYPMWGPDGTRLAWLGGVLNLTNGTVEISRRYPVWGNWGIKGMVGWIGTSIVLYNVESGEKTTLLEQSGTTKVPAGRTIREVW